MGEIVDHYPEACRGCGQKFPADERRAGSRFGRHQVAELPRISVMLVEHRTHRLACRGCGVKTTAGLPAGIGGSAFGSNLQAALVTLTARNRVSRRGMIELACDLFGVSVSIGTVDQICQRASDALAGPHAQLHDWVLDQDAVHVDETGWRTAGDGRALWTLTTPGAAVFQIAERCNREQFQALIGPHPGIIVSDRWNGYEHLDPRQRQVCWSHIQRDFRRHSEGLTEQNTFGQQGLELTLKQEHPDGYLVAQGGVRFARSLVQAGLIDEYRLVVHPVILGAGERLFTTPLTVEPVSTTAFSRGAVAHVFKAHP